MKTRAKPCEKCSAFRKRGRDAATRRAELLDGVPRHAVWTEFGTGWRMCSHCGARELPGGLVHGVPCDRCPIPKGRRATRLDVASALAALEALESFDGSCLACGCHVDNGCDCDPGCPPHDEGDDDELADLVEVLDDADLNGIGNAPLPPRASNGQMVLFAA